MSNAILVYGPSGSGKSTAIENLDPKSTGIICSDSKPLPFRGWRSKYKTEWEENKDTGRKIPIISKSNYIETKKPASIMKVLKVWETMPSIKTIVWDTMTHCIMYRFMTDPTVMGASGWDFYKTLAREIYEILDYIQKMKKDIVVIGHTDTKLDASGNKIDAIRTIGKLLDEKVEIASLFTIVFVSSVMKSKESDGFDYKFVTQTDGFTVAKSPKGMFDLHIPNDYKLVFDKIHEYDYE